VPELPRYDAPMTIRQLMNHTSGVRDHTAIGALAGISEDGLKDADALAVFARQRRTDFTPGTQWAYTNGGYSLLAKIVERVSGKSLPAFAEEQLFRPLGMTSTAFRMTKDTPKGRAVGYQQERGKWTAMERGWGAVGAGGLFSTVEDMLLWQRHMESPRLGGAKWAELTNARGVLTDGTPILYGAGVFHATFAGQTTIEHNGANPGNTAFVQRFPALRVSIVVLCNRDSRGEGNFATIVGRRVAALYVGPQRAPVAPAVTAALALTPQQQASYVGMFYNDRVPSAWPITVDSGKMVWANNRELVPIGGSRFQLAGTTAIVTLKGTDTVVFEQRPFSPNAGPYEPHPTYVRVGTVRRNLRDYAGTYDSGELPARWKVQVKDTALIIDRPKGPSYFLYRAFEDGFDSPSYGMIVRFFRDPKGEVVAMELNGGSRAWHLRFERER
jgi:CubicO group peptidase (beta-lactamase class C family)